jgi:hypothetical protein
MTGLSDSTFFEIVWLSLIGAPIVIFGLFFLIRWQWPNAVFGILIASVMVLAFSFAFLLLRLSFTVTPANYALCFLAYASYLFLAACCFQIRPKIIRFTALALAVIPVGIGYFLATYGIVLFALLLGDAMQQPYKTEQMSDRLVCRVIGWGNAVADSGYGVHLYQTWDAIPFVQRHVAQIIISETSPDSARKDATCADVLALYQRETGRP